MFGNRTMPQKRSRQCDFIICNERAAEWNRNNLWERANKTDRNILYERANKADRNILYERTNERT